MSERLGAQLQSGGLGQSIHTGLFGGGFFAGASLDLNFAVTKNIGPLVTFTRASTATFIDSAGVLQTAATDVPRFDHAITSSVTNLLLRSEEIGTSPWATNNAGATTYTANAIAAPTGAITADRVTATADFAGPNQFISAVSGLNYAFSFYIKAVTPGALDGIRIECFSGRSAQFNITTRVFSGVNAAITPSSVSVGDGWVRVQLLFTAPSTGSLAVAVYANTSSDFYLWGVQLEQSANVGTYVPTTTAAATSNTTESLGLLVEESRTNSIRNNTMVGAAAGTPGTLPTNWVVVSSGLTQTIVGTGTSAGVTYIDIRVNGTTTGAGGVQIKPDGNAGVIAATAAQAWAMSSWVAIVGGSTANTTGQRFAINEYSAGPTYLRTAVAATNILAGGATLTRVSGAITTGASTTILEPIVILDAASGVAIDITLRIGLPQLEQGAFATSVIPTTTVAATRSADVASITGTNFSSWYNGPASTIYSEAQSSSGAAYTGYCYTIGPDFNNAITHYRQSDFQPVARIRNAGVDEYGANGNGAIWTGTSLNKFALAISAASGRQASNGSLNTPGDDTSIAAPSVSSMTIGSLVGPSNLLNGTIRRLTYWPTRLPNSVLQTITQ